MIGAKLSKILRIMECLYRLSMLYDLLLAVDMVPICRRLFAIDDPAFSCFWRIFRVHGPYKGESEISFRLESSPISNETCCQGDSKHRLNSQGHGGE